MDEEGNETIGMRGLERCRVRCQGRNKQGRSENETTEMRSIRKIHRKKGDRITRRLRKRGEEKSREET